MGSYCIHTVISNRVEGDSCCLILTCCCIGSSCNHLIGSISIGILYLQWISLVIGLSYCEVELIRFHITACELLTSIQSNCATCLIGIGEYDSTIWCNGLTILIGSRDYLCLQSTISIITYLYLNDIFLAIRLQSILRAILCCSLEWILSDLIGMGSYCIHTVISNRVEGNSCCLILTCCCIGSSCYNLIDSISIGILYLQWISFVIGLSYGEVELIRFHITAYELLTSIQGNCATCLIGIGECDASCWINGIPILICSRDCLCRQSAIPIIGYIYNHFIGFCILG